MKFILVLKMPLNLYEGPTFHIYVQRKLYCSIIDYQYCRQERRVIWDDKVERYECYLVVIRLNTAMARLSYAYNLPIAKTAYRKT